MPLYHPSKIAKCHIQLREFNNYLLNTGYMPTITLGIQTLTVVICIFKQLEFFQGTQMCRQLIMKPSKNALLIVLTKFYKCLGESVLGLRQVIKSNEQSIFLIFHN